MTLAQLIAAYRTAANDKVEPYFVDDDDLVQFFNEAEAEAAVRGRLIHESSNADVCRIDIEAGVDTYALHPKLYEITHLSFQVDGHSRRAGLKLVSTEWLDAEVRRWRDLLGRPEWAVQTDKAIRLVPAPLKDGTLRIEGYRLPFEPMADEDDAPEIGEAHHIHLVQWALHRAFSIPDAEFFDAGRASAAEEAFTAYFGMRPDADLRRITRHDVPHHVEAFWP